MFLTTKAIAMALTSLAPRKQLGRCISVCSRRQYTCLDGTSWSRAHARWYTVRLMDSGLLCRMSATPSKESNASTSETAE